jgi:predicted GNAT superfamily acetyltransferase
MSEIRIIPVMNVADAKKLEELQRRTWNMDDIEILPGRFLHALHHNGACLLGAYDDDKVIGFVFGLLGTVENLTGRIDQIAAARLQMYSAIMGVLPAYQGQGIGYRLKLAQREFALRIGVRLITWTYDPLESRNAYFNVSKLGVICHQYFRDFHGVLGGINADLPTDRFYVEWWVTSNRVKGKLSTNRGALGLDSYLSGGAVVVNEATEFVEGMIKPSEEFLRSEGRILLVEIPSKFQLLKNVNIDVAKLWRNHTRSIFEYYFEHNYLVTDLVRYDPSVGSNRSFYVLTRGDS